MNDTNFKIGDKVACQATKRSNLLIPRWMMHVDNRVKEEPVEWLNGTVTLVRSDTIQTEFVRNDKSTFIWTWPLPGNKTWAPNRQGWIMKLEEEVKTEVEENLLSSDVYNSEPTNKLSIFNVEDVKKMISNECDFVKGLLTMKNSQYGNAYFQPLYVLSKASPDERMKIRIEEKLSRLKRILDSDEEKEVLSEDQILDVIGTLMMMRIYNKYK